MMYYRHQKTSRLRLPLQIISVGILAFLIFCGGLYHLRTSKQNNLTETNDAVYNPLNPNNPINPSSDNLPKQSATIKNLASGLEIGSADRGIENGILYHTVKVLLPPINRESEFYESWMVRQTPYDFFSTGEMVTNEFGEFILEWVGERDDAVLFDRIIITKELYDDNPEPFERVAEGVFVE